MRHCSALAYVRKQMVAADRCGSNPPLDPQVTGGGNFDEWI
jgi:hypothetical protein